MKLLFSVPTVFFLFFFWSVFAQSHEDFSEPLVVEVEASILSWEKQEKVRYAAKLIIKRLEAGGGYWTVEYNEFMNLLERYEQKFEEDWQYFKQAMASMLHEEIEKNFADSALAISDWEEVVLTLTESVFSWLPDWCAVWFDWCNNCLVWEDDSLTCSEKACEIEGTAECVLYEWHQGTNGNDYFSKYIEVYNLLDQYYVDADALDFQEMHENWLRGFVDGIWDPYTTYLDAAEQAIFDDHLEWSQEFEWIWSYVSKKSEGILIEEIIKWSPAFDAWLHALDVIIEIDWASTESMTIIEAVELIRWPSWTFVDLTIYREKENEILEFSVERGPISIASVMWRLFETWSSTLLIIELSSFWEDTTEQMKKVLSEHEWTYDWILLDLRWNGGGYLPVAVELASFFVERGKLVGKVEYSAFRNENFRSLWYVWLDDVPWVVLIDEMSASAAEFLAWTLSEMLWYPLVWATSFWKGSVQTIIDLEDGSSVKISIGKWFTPEWINVNDWGLVPDIEVDFSLDEYLEVWVDAQFDKWIEELLNIIWK